MLTYFDHAHSYDIPKTAEVFHDSGVVFGLFAKAMEDVPADSVHEIIPEFHHTFRRYEHLEKAIQLPRMEGRQEFAAAISCLSKAWGRDTQLDAMVEMTLDPMADLKQEDILTRVQLVLSSL